MVLVVVVLVVVGFFWFVGEIGEEAGEEIGEEIGEELRCVPASCCHVSECVLKSEAPNCSGRLCSMSCEPGTLDCGQGRCEYVDGECGVVWNE